MTTENEKTGDDLDLFQLQEALCHALGVDISDQNVKSVTLTIESAELPMVTVERYIPKGTHIKVQEVVKDKYELTKKGKDDTKRTQREQVPPKN